MNRRSMKRRVVSALVALGAIAGLAVFAAPAWAATAITGGGSTAAQPLYQKWDSLDASVSLNYQGVGSTQGIQLVEQGLVNFGASDIPLTVADLNSNGLVQFPTAMVGIVPIVHVPGIASGKLKLSGPVLAKIFDHKITTWNDAAIKALNPGLSLPGLTIQRVVRSSGSGTTWIFSHYLKAVFSSFPTPGPTVNWPGVTVGATSSANMVAQVKAVNGAIGYVEYTYAKSGTKGQLAWVFVENKAAKYPAPGRDDFAAAASGAAWKAADGFTVSLVNRPGANTWPIVGATYSLVKKSQSSYGVAHALLGFFNYGYTNSGAKTAAQNLDYVTMPSKVVTLVEAQWHSAIKAGSKPCWP